MDRRKIKKYLKCGEKLIIVHKDNTTMYDFKKISNSKYNKFYVNNFGLIVNTCFGIDNEINLFYKKCYNIIRRRCLLSYDNR